MRVRVRFFSRRVFGAWVDGEVVRVTAKSITVAARFNGVVWRERLSREATVYYPSGHPQRGQAFVV